jgi:hypothetical protein
MNTNQYQPPALDALNADYLHSAFIIDKEGNEIRITRDMITESCNRIASNEALTPHK